MQIIFIKQRVSWGYKNTGHGLPTLAFYFSNNSQLQGENQSARSASPFPDSI